MKIGYVTVSNRVMRDGCRVGYLYREQPGSEGDSGWRVFAGDETQQYADDPNNFALYHATTLIALEPDLSSILTRGYPVAFERSGESRDFVEVNAPES
jgi:hypothetical protein